MILMKYNYIRNIFITSVIILIVSIVIFFFAMETVIKPLRGNQFLLTSGNSETINLKKNEIYYIYSDRNNISDFIFTNSKIDTLFDEQNDYKYIFLENKPLGKISLNDEALMISTKEKQVEGIINSKSNVLKHKEVIESLWYKLLEIVSIVTLYLTITFGVLLLIYQKNKKFVIYRVKTVKR